MPDNVLEQESVSSDCVLGGEDGTVNAVHSEGPAIVECHIESVQRFTPPSIHHVTSPGLETEGPKIEEDENVRLECALRSVSTPNRHSSAEASTRYTHHAEF